MDWGRAKSILIVSFLLLNVLLGYQLWSSHWQQSSSTSDAAALSSETEKLLASKGIRLQTVVPKDVPKLRTIISKDVLNGSQRVTLKTPVSSSNLLGRSGAKDILAKAAVPHASVYKPDPAAGKPGVQVLTQMQGDVPMFDITLQLFEEKGKITGYKQAYVEVQSGEDQVEQKVISAYTALRSLADSMLKENAVITDVRLGYHGQRYDTDTQFMLPNWRVVLSTGETFFVEAFSGAVEGQPQASSKAEQQP